MQLISVKTSNQIWVVKIIAIFTIFFAHMPVSDNTLLLYSWLRRLYSLLGMVGVPTFFLLSGYLFKAGSLARRAKSLLIPLVIWGFLTYALHCFNVGLSSFCIKDLCLWILGYNCYLYFVPVLFVMIVLYSFYDNDYVWIVIGVLCVWLYQEHIIKYSGVFTPYMNPLNFIPYFAIGHIMRKYNLWEKLQSNLLLLLSAVVITILFILRQYYVHVWYFELYSFFVNISAAIFLISATKSIGKITDTIVTLGKCTFVIYLCHMPIATTLNKLLSKYLTGYFEPIKVLTAFIIVSVITYFGYVVLNKLHCYKFMTYLGYRK